MLLQGFYEKAIADLNSFFNCRHCFILFSCPVLYDHHPICIALVPAFFLTIGQPKSDHHSGYHLFMDDVPDVSIGWGTAATFLR